MIKLYPIGYKKHWKLTTYTLEGINMTKKEEITKALEAIKRENEHEEDLRRIKEIRVKYGDTLKCLYALGYYAVGKTLKR